MMAEKKEYACTRVAAEYGFVNEVVAAYEVQQTWLLSDFVRDLEGQSSRIDGGRGPSSRVDVSAPGYHYTLVHLLAQHDA